MATLLPSAQHHLFQHTVFAQAIFLVKTSASAVLLVLLPLCSEVSACQSRISALEGELAAASTEHSSRLSQQQKAFLAKLEQLRQVHNQQVASVITDAQVSPHSVAPASLSTSQVCCQKK